MEGVAPPGGKDLLTELTRKVVITYTASSPTTAHALCSALVLCGCAVLSGDETGMGDNIYLGDRNGGARRCNGARIATPAFRRAVHTTRHIADHGSSVRRHTDGQPQFFVGSSPRARTHNVSTPAPSAPSARQPWEPPSQKRFEDGDAVTANSAVTSHSATAWVRPRVSLGYYDAAMVVSKLRPRRRAARLTGTPPLGTPAWRAPRPAGRASVADAGNDRRERCW